MLNQVFGIGKYTESYPATPIGRSVHLKKKQLFLVVARLGSGWEAMEIGVVEVFPNVVGVPQLETTEPRAYPHPTALLLAGVRKNLSLKHGMAAQGSNGVTVLHTEHVPAVLAATHQVQKETQISVVRILEAMGTSGLAIMCRPHTAVPVQYRQGLLRGEAMKMTISAEMYHGHILRQTPQPNVSLNVIRTFLGTQALGNVFPLSTPVPQQTLR